MMQADARDLYARTSHPTRNRTGGARRKQELPNQDLQQLILLMNQRPETQRTAPAAN